MSAPSARAGAGMAYDPASKRLVLYGGEVGGSVCPHGPSRAAAKEWTATWLYDGRHWNQSDIPTATYPPPVNPTMVYDPAAHGLVMIGFGRRKDHTWLLRAGRWHRLAATTPDALLSDATTYDPVTKKVVLLDLDGKTWAFNGTKWKGMPGRVVVGRDNGFLPATIGFDPVSRKLITITEHFEGNDPQHLTAVFNTLRYQDRSWVMLPTKSTPPALSGQQPEERLVLAPGGRQLMLVVVTPPPADGPIDPTTLHIQTWKFNGHRWTKTTDAGPPPRTSYSLAYDRATKRVVLFGGHDIGQQHDHVRDDIWAFNGIRWSRQQPDLPEPPNSVRCRQTSS
ncbi:MAG TPA: hypothetical protein VHC43_06360 [Mycobacteriales bacterium]|nr:hypothetical protein [Mycobacteriales bacterium]